MSCSISRSTAFTRNLGSISGSRPAAIRAAFPAALPALICAAFPFAIRAALAICAALPVALPSHKTMYPDLSEGHPD